MHYTRASDVVLLVVDYLLGLSRAVGYTERLPGLSVSISSGTSEA